MPGSLVAAPSVLRRLVIVTIAAVSLAGCTQSGRLLTKGTVPPPGPDGRIDPSRVPDFLAVAGRDEGIAGYVAKSYMFPEDDTVEGRPGDLPPEDPPEPVYADDLRTIVGYMVVGRGFVPLTVDPSSVPTARLVQDPAPRQSMAGPSVTNQPAGPRSTVSLYVRNVSRRTAWVVVQPPVAPPEAAGFDGGAGAGCFAIPAAGRLLLLDRSPEDAGAHPIRVIVSVGIAAPPSEIWLDVANDGSITQGTGTPDWWSGDPMRC